jgi:hypothetical protein
MDFGLSGRSGFEKKRLICTEVGSTSTAVTVGNLEVCFQNQR